MNNTILLDFLKELILRLGTKQPKFFKIIGIISMATALATGLPGLFDELHIHLPSWATILQNRIIGIAATTAFFIAKLTTQSKVVAVTEGGDILKKTNDDKLPFTSKAEEKEAAKEGGLLNPNTDTKNNVVITKT